MNEHERHPHRLLVHMVWATRDREPMLPPPLDAWLTGFLRTKCAELGCRGLGVGIAWDHVHVLVEFPAAVPVASIAHRLKGASSRALARRILWQPGYFAETMNDAGPVAHLLREHRRLLDDAVTPEPWESAFENP
jgi:REP element-mobilizing transposase RayT